MLLIIIILFSLAAIFGIYLLTYVLQEKNTPKGVAFSHGTFAALGIILLIIYVISAKTLSLLSISMMLFILAALGGFYLIYNDLTGKKIPKWIAVLHGLLAVCAFLVLIFNILM